MSAGPGERHLVLDSTGGTPEPGLVALACACAAEPTPYDVNQHTYLTALTTCPQCLVVHAAWHVVFVASLDQ
jgi:hypothetical protein